MQLSPTVKKGLETFCWILAGAFILCAAPLFAGYPLFYSDSGAYINSGFEPIMLGYKPMTYGGFIRLTSMASSLWFTVIVQAIITSWLLFRLTAEFSKSVRNHLFSFFMMLIVLVAFSSASFYVGQITADIFAATLLLSAGLFLFGKKMTLAHRITAMVILFMSLSMHMSHIVMTFFILLSLGLLWGIRRIRKQKSHKTYVFRALGIAAVWGFCLIFIPWFNMVRGGEFAYTGLPHIPPIAKIIQSGTLKSYLNRNCGKPHMDGMQVCEYKDKLSGSVSHFLWDPNSIIFKLGGEEACKEEFEKLAGMVYGDFTYLKMEIGQTLRAIHMQLFTLRVGDGISSYDHTSAPYLAIKKHFPHELNNYVHSWQNKWKGSRFRFKELTNRQFVYLFICLMLSVFIIAYRRKLLLAPHHIYLMSFLMWGIYMNAYATAGFHVPLDRYQSRVAWIFPMLATLILFVRARELRRALRESFEEPDASGEDGELPS